MRKQSTVRGWKAQGGFGFDSVVKKGSGCDIWKKI